MSRRRKRDARVISPCVADYYASGGSRIIEVAFDSTTEHEAAGCLISFRRLADGTPVVSVYSADPAIRVEGPRP